MRVSCFCRRLCVSGARTNVEEHHSGSACGSHGFQRMQAGGCVVPMRASESGRWAGGRLGARVGGDGRTDGRTGAGSWRSARVGFTGQQTERTGKTGKLGPARSRPESNQSSGVKRFFVKGGPRCRCCSVSGSEFVVDRDGAENSRQFFFSLSPSPT